jgi:hypothetical protein
MNFRFVVTGTLAGAVALFAWQTLSNTMLDMVIPWHAPTIRSFQSNEMAIQAIRAVAPENGLYLAPEGSFTVVSFAPDMRDKSQDMGRLLGRQAVIDLAVAFLMTLIVTQIPARRARDTAMLFGVAGLAAAALLYFTLWNWYGFPPRWTAVNTIDTGAGWFLAGLALGAVAKRMAGHSGARGVETGVPGGDLPASRQAELSRT